MWRHLLTAVWTVAVIGIEVQPDAASKRKFYRRRAYAEWLVQQTLAPVLASQTSIAFPTAEPVEYAHVDQNNQIRRVRRADWQGQKRKQKRQNSAARQRTVTSFFGYNNGPDGTVTQTNTVGGESDPTITIEYTTPYPYSFLAPTTTDLGPDTQQAYVTAISTPNSDSTVGVAQSITPYPYISDVFTTDYGGTTSTSDYITRITPDVNTPTGTIRTVVGAPYITTQIQVDNGAGQPTSTGTSVTSASNGAPSGTGTVAIYRRAIYVTSTQMTDGRGTTSAPPVSTTTSAGTILGNQGTVSVTAYFPYVTSSFQVDNGPYFAPPSSSTSYRYAASPAATSTGTVYITNRASYVTLTTYSDFKGFTPASLVASSSTAGTVPGHAGTLTLVSAQPYTTIGSYTDLQNTATTVETQALTTVGDGPVPLTGTVSGIIPDAYLTSRTTSGNGVLSSTTTTAAGPGLHATQSTGTIGVVVPTGGANTDFTGFVYAGCISDVSRDLLPLQGTLSQSGFLQCYSFSPTCQTAKYVGLWGNRCYCGNSLGNAVVANTDGCTISCLQNNSEMCGNPDATSLYVRGGVL